MEDKSNEITVMNLQTMEMYKIDAVTYLKALIKANMDKDNPYSDDEVQEMTETNIDILTPEDDMSIWGISDGGFIITSEWIIKDIEEMQESFEVDKDLLKTISQLNYSERVMM